MPLNYVLIQETTLTASAASVTFSNIPQTGYTDLKIVVSARTDNNAGQPWAGLRLAFNGSSANMSFDALYGNGFSATSGGGTNAEPGIASSSAATSNTFGNSEFYIPNYTSNNIKSFSADGVQENNAATALIALDANLWSQTAAITSMTITSQNSWNFVANSSFSLYGIAALGTTPTFLPKASGGDIIVNDGTYWYHAFLTSNVFTPFSNLSCDVLQVAGGGGGAGYGGGGGAGGLLGFTSQALTSATNYVATIGAGGVATPYNTANIGAGNNSQFGSLTASVGGGGAGSATNFRTGGNGGSGGGAGSADPGNGNASGGTGTTGQGNNGGVATSQTSAQGGGGGGGAGAVGSTTTCIGGIGATFNTTVGGTAGPYSFINAMGSATGTGQLSGGNYYYAGGGSGQGNTAGPNAGGLGGGGSGGFGGGSDTAGTANTGGGGGSGPGTAKSGGSGIVIVRYTMA
jgi:hypothetical protein